MVKVLLDPELTVAVPEGETEPPRPAELVIVTLLVAAPCWLTVKALPAIVMLADRDAAAVLEATE
jgi:hypothetical protein